MNKTRRSVIYASLLVLTSFAPTNAFAGEKEAPRFALLVGVEKYRSLSKFEQLDGCVNDVAVMRNLLMERFHFRPDQITELVNEEATGSALRAALANLAAKVRALPDDSLPAQVVFHFSGHGSQVLDGENHDVRDEVDGLDETLVPYDADKQGGSADLRDDELFDYVEAICGEGKASMWLVLDCCHSGSGARGATKLRKLNRDLPTRQKAVPERLIAKKLPPGAIMLAACRAQEVEPEFQENGVSHGLLTRFLVQVLNEEENVSKLSYAMLREAIIARYRLDRSVAQAPVPQLEGESQLIDGSILGAVGVDRPRYWQVQPNGANRSQALMRAGAFHGVTVGSIYELYLLADQIEFKGALAENNGPSVAWLQIEAVEGANAKARVFQWDGEEQIAKELPRSFSRGYATERFHQHAGFELRLRVVQSDLEGASERVLKPDDPDAPGMLRPALEACNRSGESAWLEWVGPDSTCDVVLRIAGDKAALFPATGLAYVDPQRMKNRGGLPPVLLGGWGPFDVNTGKAVAVDDSPRSLASFLRAIARARNLLQLAPAPSHQSPRGLSPVQVRLEVVEIQSFESDGYTPKEWRPWVKEPDDSLMMPHGSQYAFRITNLEQSGDPIYVTVLSVDSNMGIDQVLPFQNGVELIGEQQLGPGESRLSDAFDCDALSFPGQRWAVVLATREPNDFYMLSQPSLPQTRGVINLEKSSLNQLLLEQAYFRPQTRGDRRRRPVKLYDESWSSEVIQWRAIPPQSRLSNDSP